MSRHVTCVVYTVTQLVAAYDLGPHSGCDGVTVAYTSTGSRQATYPELVTVILMLLLLL